MGNPGHLAREAVTAYLALGSNIDAATNLRAAVRLLAGYGTIVAASPVYETAPVGDTRQPRYLNAVVALETNRSLEELSSRLIPDVEGALGRVRTGDRFAPRTIDVDLLLYGNAVTTVAEREVPSPEIVERAFVAIPLADVAPLLTHPVTHETMRSIADTFHPTEDEMHVRNDVILVPPNPANEVKP